MAELTLILEVDPTTGGRRLRLDLVSEPDALPAEHEEAHARALGQVLGDAAQAGGALRVRREAPGRVPVAARECPAAEPRVVPTGVRVALDERGGAR